MIIAAIVEKKRLDYTKQHHMTMAMSVVWLAPQFIVIGIADSLTLVGLQEYFYDQVPDSMRSLGIAFYLSVIGAASFVNNILMTVLLDASRFDRYKSMLLCDCGQEIHLQKSSDAGNSLINGEGHVIPWTMLVQALQSASQRMRLLKHFGAVIGLMIQMSWLLLVVAVSLDLFPRQAAAVNLAGSLTTADSASCCPRRIFHNPNPHTMDHQFDIISGSLGFNLFCMFGDAIKYDDDMSKIEEVSQEAGEEMVADEVVSFFVFFIELKVIEIKERKRRRRRRRRSEEEEQAKKKTSKEEEEEEDEAKTKKKEEIDLGSIERKAILPKHPESLDSTVVKYGDIVSQLSDYPPVDFNGDKRTHCFKEAIVGLKIQDELTVDSSMMIGNKTILDFRNVLDQAYWPRIRGLIQDEERDHAVQEDGFKKPKLVILSRNGSREILNERLLVELAEEIGFTVEVLRPNQTTELAKIYRCLNSSHVMIGVHGDAMTHFLFLKPKTVFIQIIPIGTEWAAETFYGEPAKKMRLKYIGYKIKPKESSLYGEYNPIIQDPKSFTRKGWDYTKKIYLERQNVKLDLKRFRKPLFRAYDLSIKRIGPVYSIY
ncbi:Xylan glycosyltransferase MUCI21 [Cardamine amara subsp. amara]|uniref:Xylan glycosyltransferase MUCI21 n=1 Tax=Cardamine amara subsp. amara TaxID=228776 RepID=A0ABD1C812_CARAN